MTEDDKSKEKQETPKISKEDLENLLHLESQRHEYFDREARAKEEAREALKFWKWKQIKGNSKKIFVVLIICAIYYGMVMCEKNY